MTVTELLTEEPAAAQVLGLYHIDLCLCSGLAVRSAAILAGASPCEVARGVHLVRQQRESRAGTVSGRPAA